MSGSLATIAADCISELLQYIDGNDFISLMMTGNRLLRHKLRQKCSLFSLEDMPCTLFPFSALRLTNLRSLVVHGIKEVPTYLDFRRGDDLGQSLGHKTLQKIELDFANAFAFFKSLDPSIPRLTVRDRFPTLTTLILRGFAIQCHIESLFGEFPQTLTALDVAYGSDEVEKPVILLEEVAKLPRQLKSLKLSGAMLVTPEEDYFDLKNFFPPNLEHLELCDLDSPLLLDYCPLELKILTVSAQGGTHDFKWKTSKIPKTLVELRATYELWSFELDAPLPSTLEIFEYTSNNPDMSIDDLPTSLKYVNFNKFIRFSGQSNANILSYAESAIKRFPNIERAELFPEYDASWLTNRLKSLKVLYHLPRFACPLPNSLTELTLSFPILSGSLKHLPSSLKSLEVAEGNEFLNFVDFTPWTADDIAYLVSKMQLEHLDIEMQFFESNESLAPLSKMTSLKNFILQNIGLDDMLASPKWLPKCLPRYLENLDIRYQNAVFGYAGGVRRPISDNFLRLCNLGEVVPHLRKLFINCEHPVPVRIGPFFATLPERLAIFDCYFEHTAIWTMDFAVRLPRYLKSFYLWTENQTGKYVFNEHMEGLPTSLQDLTLRFGLNAEFDEDLLEILPDSIVDLSVELESDDSSLDEAIDEWLLSNPLLQAPNM